MMPQLHECVRCRDSKATSWNKLGNATRSSTHTHNPIWRGGRARMSGGRDSRSYISARLLVRCNHLTISVHARCNWDLGEQSCEVILEHFFLGNFEISCCEPFVERPPSAFSWIGWGLESYLSSFCCRGSLLRLWNIHTKESKHVLN